MLSYRTYKTWAASLKPNTSEAGSYLAKRTEIAEALLRVKNVGLTAFAHAFFFAY